MRPNFFFLPQKNFFEPTPTFSHCLVVGFRIQINIPSRAPTQFENPALDFDKKPAASPANSNETNKQNKITLDIVVKETDRKLCTLYVNEKDTITKVKEEILRKNKKVVVKNLFIKEE